MGCERWFGWSWGVIQDTTYPPNHTKKPHEKKIRKKNPCLCGAAWCVFSIRIPKQHQVLLVLAQTSALHDTSGPRGAPTDHEESSTHFYPRFVSYSVALKGINSGTETAKGTQAEFVLLPGKSSKAAAFRIYLRLVSTFSSFTELSRSLGSPLDNLRTLRFSPTLRNTVGYAREQGVFSHVRPKRCQSIVSHPHALLLGRYCQRICSCTRHDG